MNMRNIKALAENKIISKLFNAKFELKDAQIDLAKTIRLDPEDEHENIGTAEYRTYAANLKVEAYEYILKLIHNDRARNE